MYQTTQAVAQALSGGAVRYRLLSEHAPLWASDSTPLLDSDGRPLFVVAQGVGAGNGTTQEQLVSLNYTALCCDGDIGIGTVCAATLSGTVQGAVSMLGEIIRAEIGAEVDGAVTWLPLGRFVVDECTRSDDDTRFTAHDANFYALGGAYVPNVASGSSVTQVLADLAGQCGLEVEQSTLNLGLSIPVNGDLTGLSCRDMLKHLALLCGKNCVVSREGRLRFVWFADSGETVDAQSYYDGALSNGGASCLSGLSCTVPAREEGGVESVLTVGRAASALSVESPYMTGSRLEAIWQSIGDWSYPAGEVEFCGGVLLEPGDLVWVTNRSGVSVRFPVMQTALTLDGGCRCSLKSWGRAQVARENAPATPLRQQMTQLEENARRAMLSANGKNRVFHQSTAPTEAEGLTAGDTWFDTLNDNRVNTWTGSRWSPFELGEDALADLSITNAKIRDGTIQNAKIANLDAGKLTTGTLDADRIGAGSITADKIDVADLFSQNITCTNKFELDTEFCNLETTSNGFFLYVNSTDQNYGSGMNCVNNGLSLYSCGQTELSGGTRLTLDSGGDLEMRNAAGLNLIRLQQEGGIWLHADNEAGDGTAFVEANRFKADLIKEGGIALRDKYCKKLRIRSIYFSIRVNANSTANGSMIVGPLGSSFNRKSPIAVAGFRFPSTYSSYMTLFRSYLDGNTYYWAARNRTDNDYTGQLVVDILYVDD